jgi:uncharacterized protein
MGIWVVNRKWKDGDKITVILPSDLHYEAMPDNPDRRALFYGPVLIAGDFGEKALDPAKNIPVFVTADTDANRWVKRKEGLTIHFSKAILFLKLSR